MGKKLMKPTSRLRNVIDFLKNQENLTNEELSLALGYKTKSYVSDILGGSKIITRLFIDRLKAYYNINPDYILGVSEKMIVEKIDSNFSHEKKEGSGDEKYQKLLEDNDRFFKDLLKSNLNGLVVGQKSILAHLTVGFEQFALKEAQGDKKKAEKIKNETDKRIVEVLQEGLKTGSLTDVGKSGRK